MEVTRCFSGADAGQSPKGTLDVTPIVPLLVLTPHKYAVAVHAESAT